MRSFVRNSLFVVVVVGISSGCDNSSTTKFEPPAEPPRCERDAARIAVAPACIVDDDCPCGTACVLGHCLADCMGDAECDSGKRCSEFGRCESTDSLVPPVQVQASPSELVISAPTLRSATGDSVKRFRITAKSGTSPTTVRVAPELGLRVACGAPGTTTEAMAVEAACESLVTDSLEVLVVPTTTLLSGESLSVSVFWNNQRNEVSYQVGSFLTQPLLVQSTGLFEGTATLQRVGIGIAPAPGSNGVLLDDGMVVPVTIEVHANGLWRILDPLRAIAPTGILDAELVDGPLGSPSEFHADSHSYTDSSIATDAAVLNKAFDSVHARYAYVDLGGSVTPTEVSLDTLAEGRLRFELPVYFDISSASERALAAVWGIAVSRTGDLPTDAISPSPPAFTNIVYGPALDLDVRMLPTRWESAAFSRVETDEQKLFAALWDQNGTSLELCGGFDRLALLSGDRRDAMLHSNMGLVFNAVMDAQELGDPGMAQGRSWKLINHIPLEDAPPFVRDVAMAFKTNTETPVSIKFEVRVFPGRTPAVTIVPFRGEHILDSMHTVFRPEIPCSMTVPIGKQYPTPQVTPDLFLVDRCQELADRTGCVPQAATPGDNAVVQFMSAIQLRYADATLEILDLRSPFWATVFSVAPAYAATINQVCTMPEMPPRCAELWQCHSGDPQDALVSSPAAGSFFSESGDAVCRDTGRSLGIDADDNPQLLNAGEMFAACLHDLESLDAPASPGDDLFDSLNLGACLNHTRFLTALDASSWQLRIEDLAPMGADLSIETASLAHRLLVRWVRVHGYLANEMVEQNLLARVLRRSISTDPSLVPPSSDRVQTVSSRVWDLLTHPRFAAVLDNMPGSVLARVDYRSQRFSATVPEDVADDPTESLSTAIYDTIRSQIDLVGLRLQRARYRPDPVALDALGPVLRGTVLGISLAEELAARAVAACAVDSQLCGGGSEPLWYPRYQTARSRAQNALKKTLATAAALRAGTNPFGIEESDLPLYFANTPDTDDGRFFAISDYLIGSSPQDLRAWAPPLIVEAEQDLQMARLKWLERQQRQIITQRDALARVTRITNAQGAYGEKILNLCGRPGDQLISGNVLDQWEGAHGRPFNANDCFLDLGNPTCRPDPTKTLSLYGTADAQYSICLFDELFAQEANPGYADAAIQTFAENCPSANVTYVASDSCSSSTGYCLRCSSPALEVAALGGDFLAVGAPVDMDATLMTAADRTCRSLYPEASNPLPGIQNVVGQLASSCYRGSIGEQASAMRSAALEVEIANKEYDEFIEAYNIGVSACSLASLNGDALAAAQERHNKQMKILRVAKAVADSVAEVASSTAACTATAASTSSPFQGGFTAVSCAANVVEGASRVASIVLETTMDNAEADFALQQQETQNMGDYNVCLIEAKQYRVGMKSQQLRIQQASEGQITANIAFHNLIAIADLAYDDGMFTVDFERGRRISPLVQDLWIDEDVRAFDRSFRIAHRMTYLAVRAVEYEFQQSLDLRGAALAAEIPDDLTAVLQELRSYTGPRTVFGSRPGQKKAILSLRDDLLGLSDETDLPASELEMTAVERLQSRLRSSRNAVYDAQGNYLGQEIEFTVAPSRLGGVASSGQLFSQNFCAERLWSVNASILGGAEILRGQESTFTNLTIKKANTFFSQWCVPAYSEKEYQVVSVRPERNLFRDPENSGASFIDYHLSGISGEPAAKALIQPSTNVDRIAFEDDAYENGDSSQLAARGLYGQYSLFFPAQALSIEIDGVQSDGLDLSKVADILVRFDYITAAN